MSNWPLDKTLGIVDSSGRKVYLIDTTKVQRVVEQQVAFHFEIESNVPSQ